MSTALTPDSNCVVVRFIRKITRGVPRHHKAAYLLRRWHHALRHGCDPEATAVRTYLGALMGDGVGMPLRVPFNFNALSSKTCKNRFRFANPELVELASALELQGITTREGTTATGIEGLCIMLYKLAVPTRWEDVQAFFGYRSISGLSNIFMFMIEFLDTKYKDLVKFNHEYTANNVNEYADAIFNKGAHMHNVWSFIDGTLRGICRPAPRDEARDGKLRSQQSVYSGHRRKHALKYQSLTTPDEMISHLYGPFPGRSHDIKLSHESGLAATIRADSRFSNFRIFGDQAYGRDDVLASPFGGALANLSRDEKLVNASMSKVRVTVEWSYGEVCNYWSALDFKRQAHTGTQPIGQMYRVGVLLTNCLTCLRGNNVSDYFDLEPPSLRTYLQFN